MNRHSVNTNTLLSLTGKSEENHGFEVFPPMPTPHDNSTACITTEKVLVVAGGTAGDDLNTVEMTTEKVLVVAGGTAGDDLNTVEVMDINAKPWTTVCPLPQKQFSFQALSVGTQST